MDYTNARLFAPDHQQHYAYEFGRRNTNTPDMEKPLIDDHSGLGGDATLDTGLGSDSPLGHDLDSDEDADNEGDKDA